MQEQGITYSARGGRKEESRIFSVGTSSITSHQAYLFRSHSAILYAGDQGFAYEHLVSAHVSLNRWDELGIMRSPPKGYASQRSEGLEGQLCCASISKLGCISKKALKLGS